MNPTPLIASLLASAAITGTVSAGPDPTPVALDWQPYTGHAAGHVYVNITTGERVYNSAAATGAAARSPSFSPNWATTIPDPCEGAAGVNPLDQSVGVFTGIMSAANGDLEQPNGVRLWQNWFDAPPESFLLGIQLEYYTGLQDPGFTPGDPNNFGDPQGIPGYDLILVFTERDDRDSQSTAVAHSPIVVTQLAGANDDDGSGVIEFTEGRLWTIFVDLAETPIQIADADNSSGNPQGVDLDEPGTVGHGSADCGFVVTFRQPNVIEGDRMFRDNELIDFSNVDLDPVTGIGNPDGPDPDFSTFVNILPTGTGLYAPSNRLETFAATPEIYSEWPVDTSVIIEEQEGFGSWDAMELFDATGADESGEGFQFYFGGFSCFTPGGGTDGYENPYSATYIGMFLSQTYNGPCCRHDFAEPYCVIDLADITGFLQAFLVRDPDADLVPDGLFDLADITDFITRFLGEDCTF